MKKSILFSVLTAGAVVFGLTSCDSKSGSSLKTDIDSVSYAYGVLNGQDMATGIKSYPKKIDVDQLINGISTAVNSDTTKMSYELGMQIGINMKNQFQSMSERDLVMNKKIFMQALSASLKGDSTLLSRQKAEEVYQTFMKAFQEKQMKAEQEKLANTPEAKKNKADGEKFLAEKAKEKGVKKTASGLLYKVNKEGKGEKPTATSNVKVNYKGTLIDGKEFDANKKTSMNVAQVVPGFREALMMMTPGSSYTVYIPAELGYGVRQAGSIPMNSVLVFDIDLLEVEPSK
ncbi:FKBP-type peptidyl-prolyl cis-trans isomerase [Coprobacter tertius]|uniref:Peptidyl-prolyl cis-trans isomerase n=1 Tax=Coprobacter tertius TaxID=2944915 RepID=A0ABT1MEC8_9BACT|nr:FKBP-type peptidyl-prolyl cis-trans isomerase [Coprobacter tertius]MCP9610724.1 FKBP-type peptidyl-prolyl cis-trans isomerase [Coprobacter tertius]